ncbi:50S ribosomal protein L23 [Candidatus Woesebacteria bacterium]|nr:50S ribosomal protein L23 [Candidatus Woesebacteria bacterium]
MAMNPFILKSPLITEKTYRLAQTNHVYTFEVDPGATKGQIREAVQETFGVNVLTVTTSKIAGRVKRTGRKRMSYVIPKGKKAMVKIQADQTIEVFAINE